jgi:ornithine cyclodeaminase/alanine dehydrogenase-like protein (mu-crystallin family)
LPALHFIATAYVGSENGLPRRMIDGAELAALRAGSVALGKANLRQTLKRNHRSNKEVTAIFNISSVARMSIQPLARRVGLIGAGYISTAHAEALNALKYPISAIVDTNRSLAESLVRQCGADFSTTNNIASAGTTGEIRFHSC